PLASSGNLSAERADAAIRSNSAARSSSSSLIVPKSFRSRNTSENPGMLSMIEAIASSLQVVTTLVKTRDGVRIGRGSRSNDPTPRQPARRPLARQNLRVETLYDVIAVRHFGPDLDQGRTQQARRLYPVGMGFNAGHRHAVAGQRTGKGAQPHAGMNDTAT